MVPKLLCVAVQRFLNDVEQPVRVLQDPQLKSADDVCFLIVKKPKAAKKPVSVDICLCVFNSNSFTCKWLKKEGEY